MERDVYLLVEHLRGQVADISYVLAAAGRELARATGGRTLALLFGQDASSLASDLNVDQVLYMEHPALEDFTPDAYLQALEAAVGSDPPRALLFGHTSIGMDVASGTAARLNLPIISQCKHLTTDGDRPGFVSQICGGKMMAEGELPEPTAVLTLLSGGYPLDAGRSEQAPELRTLEPPPLADLRVEMVGYHEPEAGDVDITKTPVLIAVGRGLKNQADMELIEELAEALGAAVCASRPIVDLGWLPITRLVGKSGKTVKPEIYLALGISGAPEHVEGIVDSGLIIAVNTDPDAPIFDVAQYGLTIDMLDLVEALSDQLQLSVASHN
jgi:electron transfer flavoprotein alpha subunit